MLSLRPDDLTSPETLALIDEHVAEMCATSPAESCHVQAADELAVPGTMLYTAWDGGQLVAMGAIKRLDAERGELKSMRTVEARRGTGAGRAMLRGLIDAAREAGYRSLWLETGVEDLFVPARALYESEGFVRCQPFGSYTDDPLSVFYTLRL